MEEYFQNQIKESQWKNDIMWNPTIPEEKKFSTVIRRYPPSSIIKYNLTLQQALAHGVWRGGAGDLLPTSSLLYKVSELLYWPAKSTHEMLHVTWLSVYTSPYLVFLTNESSRCSRSWFEKSYPVIPKCYKKKFWILDSSQDDGD